MKFTKIPIQNSKFFLKLWRLYGQQKWLSNHEEAVNILFNDCKTDEEKYLIIDLLFQFSYLNSEMYTSYLIELAKDIVSTPGSSQDTSIVCAMASGSKADSSQGVIYALKPIFQRLEWENILLLSRSDQVHKKVKELLKSGKTINSIFIVDEFIGSGTTVVNTNSAILNNLLNSSVTQPIQIQFNLIAGCNHGINYVEQNGINIKVLKRLPKGISDYYSVSDVQRKINAMVKIENMLHPTYNNKNLPSLGYGASEALYGRQDGNVPNNVFPVFWWPYYLSHSSESLKKRVTLLTRLMGDA